MQYILTQAEYDALKAEQEYHIRVSQQKLQDFCTLVANHLPINTWMGDETPWGCTLTKEYEHFCDYCPARAFCPSQDKRWSK